MGGWVVIVLKEGDGWRRRNRKLSRADEFKSTSLRS